jgi:hypothetical protein
MNNEEINDYVRKIEKEGKRIFVKIYGHDAIFSGFFENYILETRKWETDYDAIEFFHLKGIGGRLVGDIRELMYHDGCDMLSKYHEEFNSVVEQAKDHDNAKKVIYCVTYAEDEDGVEPEEMKDADSIDAYCVAQGSEIPSDTIAILEYDPKTKEYEEVVRIRR